MRAWHKAVVEKLHACGLFSNVGLLGAKVRAALDDTRFLDIHFDPATRSYSYALSRMTEVASNIGKVVRVLIRLSTHPDTSQRLELERAAARLIRDVQQGGLIRASVICVEIEVQETSGQFDDDFLEDGTLNENGRYAASADVCFLQSQVSPEQLMQPICGSSFPLQREKQSQAFLWLPPQVSRSPEERISQLSDRIAEKLKQIDTKERKAKQIVIIQVPEGVGRGWNDHV